MAVINLRVNGKKISKEITDNSLLSDFLRDKLSLTGTHIGCDTSQCGACTVHLNGLHKLHIETCRSRRGCLLTLIHLLQNLTEEYCPTLPLKFFPR